jgi:hypothetical protein
MPNFDRRTTIVTRHEYILDAPTNHVEVAKMLTAIRQDLADQMRVEVNLLADDAIFLTTEDEMIIAYWEEKTDG